MAPPDLTVFLPVMAWGQHLGRSWTGMGTLCPWGGHHIPEQGLTVKAPKAGQILNPIRCQEHPRSDAAAGAVARLGPGGK